MSKRSLSFILSPILFSALSAQAVINGELAKEDIYQAVGALKLGKEKNVSCTATLINEKWIVTADHCVSTFEGNEEGEGEAIAPSHYEFRLGADFKKPIFKTKLKRWVNFDPEAVEDLHLDMAFGELETAVPLKALKITPISISNQKWNEGDLKASYIHIGYGQREAFSSKKSPWDGKRQLAKMVVTNTEGNALLKLFQDSLRLKNYIQTYHPGIDLEYESLESIIFNGELVAGSSVHAWDQRGRTDLNNVSVPDQGWQDSCFGDSGGPLLRNVNGVLKIVGVVSSGMNRVCENFGTRFTIFGSHVRSLMRKNSIK